MLKDAQGLEVTTNSPIAIAAIDLFVDRSLGYGNDALVILDAIAADPACAIAYAHAAAHYLSLESAEAKLQAAPYIQAANKYLNQVNEREKLYVWAIDAWASGDVDRAIAYHEEIAQKYPRDLASVQRGQYHYFYLGNKQGLLDIALKVLPANRENHYLYGMIAFGLEQCHRLEEAEQWGRQATQMNRYDPWAHHAVAHVMETQGRLDEGIAWMESHSDTWNKCNSLLYTHNWWHIALYYLEKEEIPKVLKLYDTHVWGRAWKESSKDQVGAISLLLRLELRGVDVGDRWAEVAKYLTPRIHEHALPFQDLHYVYALARAGQNDQLTKMLLSMQAYAKNAKPFIQRTWSEVVLPAARGMVAHAKVDWERAIAQLRPTLPRLYEIGGSHAQRDLFEQVYLDAWLRAEQNYEALHILEKRIASRRTISSIPSGLSLNYAKVH
ncbi:tetratricopeptide repeat protein [Microcoleus sp. FACHB-831]|uniref:tetratricopeptide repeat protein n=1 Tax=Microcoleus sp. FACHB-831 TaxID=2692827 RepID=UPI001688C4BA|nr:tetratricopeptide repeat protein [Microcoleus sp. FACHB-831]MBD1920128.1 tetratricopeptide repeat protein [Microcoleus sp. FACHB-831]